MSNIVVAIYNPLIRDGGIFPYFETFLEGLKKYGNNVLCFEKSAIERKIKESIPETYLNEIKKFKPDLFIFVNNQFWDISKYFDQPIIILDVDSPNVYANIENLQNNGRYKYMCITKDGIDLIKNNIFCKNSDIRYLPPFTGVQADYSVEQNINIAFCGSHWLWNDFKQVEKFLSKGPNDKERQIAKDIYNRFKEFPFKDSNLLYQEMFGYNLKKELEFENLYIFSTRVSGLKRLRLLLEIEDLGLEIRGHLWNCTDSTPLKAFPELLLSYSNNVVNNTKTTQDFYNSAKIGFNTTHIQAQGGFGFRVADILASNACLVTEASSDLKELGFTCPTYTSAIEAHEICKKLLKNENMRKDIVAQCNEIIDKKHRFENILEMIEDFIGIRLQSPETGSLKFICTDNNKENTNKITNSNKISNSIIAKQIPFFNKPRPQLLKNKLQYEVWKTLDLKMSNIGVYSGIKPISKYNKILYKIWKHLHKKLKKKGIISDIGYWEKIEHHNQYLQNQLRDKYKQDGRIKVAFLHMYASSLQCYGIFDKMLNSEIFDPYWIVNPDVLRSKENFDKQYEHTKETLIAKYGIHRVLDGYDYKNDKFIDFTDQFDLATTTNPYEGMANKLFQIRYWTSKVPMFYISYFYMGRCFVTVTNLKNPQFNHFSWIFAENNFVKELAEKYQAVQGRNIFVTGYCKMDSIKDIKITQRKRKRIIISPHHLIEKGEMNCGAFFDYCEDLLILPQKYKNIDFVYRPHPMLEEKLNNIWGEEKTQKWLNKMLSYSNVTYSTEGDYLELFVNSDALIHDCGSFMAEYLFTNHPCAYLKKNTANYDKIHTDFGHRCENVHYKIYTKNDLFNFIDQVVIKEKDGMKEIREKFAKSEIMINFPNVTDNIINFLTKKVTGGD